MNDSIHLARIHIIGGPGSGKTTLARQIAGTTGAPLYELDNIGYENGAGTRRPLHAKLADLHDIAAQPAWITEGIFLWWTDELLHRADMIVWLDPPVRVDLWRIVSRHVRTSLAGTNKHRGVRALVFFLRNAFQYYRGEAIQTSSPDDDSVVTRAATIHALSEFEGNVVRCRTRSDVARLIRSLNSG